MKIENETDPYMWLNECLGPEPQDWMKDVGLDWFDEDLLGRPESPQPTINDDADRHHHQYHNYPYYTIESSAWLIQQNQHSTDSEEDSSPPPVLPPMIPGTRSFSDELHKIRKPYALGSPTNTMATTGLSVSCFHQILECRLT